MKQALTVSGFAWRWGRYRYRLFKRYEDVPRDFNEWRTICFAHRVSQSLCHCEQYDQHERVTPKIAIPKQTDRKGWERLRAHLLEVGDQVETVRVATQLPLARLTPRQRLLNRLLKIKPEIFHQL